MRLTRTEAWIRDKWGPEVADEISAELERALEERGPGGVLAALRRKPWGHEVIVNGGRE